MVLKLCDFGLARNLYEKTEYASTNIDTELPLKWMAPESFDRNVFTPHSDVWSFGVCCWEIFTLGVEPYLELSNQYLLSMIRDRNHRLYQPEYCPGGIYSLMKDCWASDPNDRPSFELLAPIFNEFVNQYEVASLNASG